MPNTPKHGLPYPSTGSGNDVPYDLQRLAEAVDDAIPTASTWQTFVPVTAGLNVAGHRARYKDDGDTIELRVDLALGGAATAGATITLPVPAAAGNVNMVGLGTVLARKSTGQRWQGLLEQDGNAQNTVATWRIMVPFDGTNNALANVGPSGSVFVPANGDSLSIYATYEKATGV